MKKLFSNRLVKSIIAFTVTVILITVMVFVCFNKPKQVKAEVVSATILGVSALLAFLAAQGVSLSFNGLSDDSISSEVNSMMSGYTKDGQTWADWNTNTDWVDWLVGKENKTKFMCLSYEFLNWASDLPDWLKTTFGLNINSNSTVTGGSGLLLDGGSVLPVSSFLGGYSYNQDGVLIYPLSAGSSFSYTLSNGNSFGLHVSNIVPGPLVDRFTLYYYTIINGVVQSTTSKGSLRGNYCIALVHWQGDSSISLRCIGYESNYLTSTIGFLIDPADIQTVINSGDISTIGIEGSLTDGYQDLQDALDQDLTDQVGNPDAVGVIDVGGLAGVTQEQLTDELIEKIVAGDLDIDGVGVDVYDDAPTAEEDKDAEEVPSAGQLEDGIVIVDGLEDFFPFCIPFDLYEIIAKLNVEPVTPDFTYTISFGGLFDDAEIEIDLSEFDTVARVFRIMMAVGFAVFLIIKTRDLIRG